MLFSTRVNFPLGLLLIGCILSVVQKKLPLPLNRQNTKCNLVLTYAISPRSGNDREIVESDNQEELYKAKGRGIFNYSQITFFFFCNGLLRLVYDAFASFKLKKKCLSFSHGLGMVLPNSMLRDSSKPDVTCSLSSLPLFLPTPGMELKIGGKKGENHSWR